MVASADPAREAPLESLELAAVLPAAVPAEEDEEIICRYCFEGEEEGELVSPCNCAGGQKFVHLVCLRRWQRGVLTALPTHPDFYSAENRQRVCNICASPFTVPPPTQLELLSSFTGQEVADLIAEGNFIGSHRDFSDALARQISGVPSVARDFIARGQKHWIGGLFLIARVCCGARNRRKICRMRIDDESDLDGFSRVVENCWTFEIQGRRHQIILAGPLAGTDVPEDAPASEVQRVLRALTTPVILTLRAVEDEDEKDPGEDSVMAVNLTRRIDFCKLQSGSCEQRGTILRQEGDPRQETFERTCQEVLRQEGDAELLMEVQHYQGGPCDEENPSCCIMVRAARQAVAVASSSVEVGHVGGVISSENGGPFYTVFQALIPALREAQSCAKREGLLMQRSAIASHTLDSDNCPCAGSGPQAPSEPPPSPPLAVALRAPLESPHDHSSEAPPVSSPTKRRKLVDDHDIDGASHAALQPTSGVRLLVFWGSAGWTRRQLLAEIARGSWGLCPIVPDDEREIAEREPANLWEAVYARLRFAPTSEMSENFEARAQRPGLEALHRVLLQRRLDLRAELVSRASSVDQSAGQSVAESSAIEEAEDAFLDEQQIDRSFSSSSNSSSSSSSSCSVAVEGSDEELMDSEVLRL